MEKSKLEHNAEETNFENGDATVAQDKDGDIVTPQHGGGVYVPPKDEK